jgi:glycerol-1-phosphate dehydrogenase [NAD(P)+]
MSIAGFNPLGATNATDSLTRALALARETRALKLGWKVLKDTSSIVRQLFGGRAVILVMDENTEKVAGRRLIEELGHEGHPMQPPFIFQNPDLYAESRFVTELEKALLGHDAIPIAVGSGTVNDLVKLASFRQGRPYISVATAASMDGYTAFGASITHEGAKQTFTCPAPTGVVADLEIISSAPPALNASGYADLLAKVTAGADWLLADALGEEPLVPEAWEIVQGSLRSSVANPEGVVRQDPEAIAHLTEGLMMGGFAMQCAQSSRPASGAEHQFSHLWDMQHHTHNGSSPSHGFKVGIGTLASAALYEFLFEQPLDKIEIELMTGRWPKPDEMIARARSFFGGSDLADISSKELLAKHPAPAELRDQLKRLATCWPELREQLREQLLPFDELRNRLRLAGAAYEPEQIGISRQRLRESFWLAFSIRRRFTVLDLAVRTGLLEPALSAIFGPQGHWPI